MLRQGLRLTCEIPAVGGVDERGVEPFLIGLKDERAGQLIGRGLNTCRVRCPEIRDQHACAFVIKREDRVADNEIDRLLKLIVGQAVETGGDLRLGLHRSRQRYESQRNGGQKTTEHKIRPSGNEERH
ncbi:hypothetical protein D3C86_1216730 [compost metagenome]